MPAPSPEDALIDASARQALQDLLGTRVQFDESLARHTSLRVGGPVDALARPQSRKELLELSVLCRKHALPIHTLGMGFNTLVRDGGLRGVALRLSGFRAFDRIDNDIWAEAGVTHSTLSRFCAEQGLTGLEFGVGIPGTIGGWIAMNAGIPEREMKDVVLEVELFDPGATDIRHTPAAELDWNYRHLNIAEDVVVLSARFALTAGDAEAIRAEQRIHLAKRRKTQPVDEPSCGSVFKNPEGDRAGRLIEAADLKGTRAGDAQISKLHANFIVTGGEARASDVLTLIERAKRAVDERFGVGLATEVVIVGESD